MDELSEDSNSPEVLKERKTAFENYRKLYDTLLFADVEFDVKGAKFLAHKLVLAAQTEYYRDLFTADAEEAKTGKIKITDFDPDVFKIVLEFIYKGELFNAPEKLGTHAEDLIKAANKVSLTIEVESTLESTWMLECVILPLKCVKINTENLKF